MHGGAQCHIATSHTDGQRHRGHDSMRHSGWHGYCIVLCEADATRDGKDDRDMTAKAYPIAWGDYEECYSFGDPTDIPYSATTSSAKETKP